MLIGELAEKTKLSRHTIRFYEKIGLIDLPKKSRRDNNYKEYPDDVLRQIAAIQKLKEQGFTLKEAKATIKLMMSGTLDPERGRKYVLLKVRRIEKQIAQLQRMKEALLEVADQVGEQDCAVRQILDGGNSALNGH